MRDLRTLKAALALLLLGSLYSSLTLANTETESNDTSVSANTLTSGVTMSGHLYSDSDEDYYKITSSSAGTLIVQTDGYNSASVQILNASLQVVGADSSIYGSGEVWIGMPSAGTYYVRVYGTYTSTSQYTVTATLYSNTGIAEVEQNNSSGQANTLTSGVTMSGHLYSDSDEDYYKITSSSAGTLIVQTDGYNSASVQILNASLQVVGADSSIYGSGEVWIGMPSAGTYYVRVYGTYTSTSQYTVKATLYHAVGGTVTGLDLNQSVTLDLNGVESLTVTSDGTFTFTNRASLGLSITVQVTSQPTGQTCRVTNGSRVVSGEITDIEVICEKQTYQIGGELSGLVTGQSLALTNNGGSDLELTADGAFMFPESIAHGASYEVEVSRQPTGQSCSVNNGSGVATSAIDNVSVTCSINEDAVPGAPSLSLSAVTESSVTLINTVSNVGGSPVTSFETSCEIPSLSNRVETRGLAAETYLLGEPTSERRLIQDQQGNQRQVGRIYRPTPELWRVELGDKVAFTTPAGDVVIAPVVHSEKSKFGNLLLEAKTDNVDILAVVSVEGDFASSIQVEDDYFTSRIVMDQTVVYSSEDGEIVSGLSQDDYLIPQFDPGTSFSDGQLTDNRAGPTIISVGVQYDNATRDAYNATVQAELVIAYANRAYQDSDVDIRFEIVGIRNYDSFASSADMYDKIYIITCGEPSCDPLAADNANVMAWRDQAQADMIVQLVRYGDDAGGGRSLAGLGWIPADDYLLQRVKDLTYSVSALEFPNGGAFGDHVVAHEMGHNLGLAHDVAQGGDGYYTYGRGYKNSLFGTVMSYTDNYARRLSNPELTYQGLVTGVPIGESGEAHAAQAVSNIMGIHEQIYDNGEYFTVSTYTSAGGSISPTTAAVLEGNTATFSLNPQLGFAVAAVQGCNGTLRGNTYVTGPVTTDCTITATFQQYTWSRVSSTGEVSFTNLPGGYTYNCTSVATNSFGQGARSDVLSFALAPPPLAPPTITSIEAGDGFVYVNVSTANDGGAEITAISAECTFGNLVYTGQSVSSPVLVSGLLNGRTYACSARATNVNGTSPASASVSATLAQTMPSQPIISSTDYGDSELTVFVSESTQLTTVDSYKATCTDGTNTYTGTSASSAITVSGLTNGVAYTCTVTATNSVGTSSASAATDPITPEETITGLPVWLLYQATQ